MRWSRTVTLVEAHAEGEVAGGPGARPRRGVWGLGPQNQKGRLAVRSLGVASPRGADAGPRGEVSGESFSQKGLIVYSVSG